MLRRVHALGEHRACLSMHVGAEDAAGVEAARVVHHDRRLADLPHEVEGARPACATEVCSPTMISTSGMLVHGR
jgi:hypothetical protein